MSELLGRATAALGRNATRFEEALLGGPGFGVRDEDGFPVEAYSDYARSYIALRHSVDLIDENYDCLCGPCLRWAHGVEGGF